MGPESWETIFFNHKHEKKMERQIEMVQGYELSKPTFIDLRSSISHSNHHDIFVLKSVAS